VRTPRSIKTGVMTQSEKSSALPARAKALIDFWFGPEGDPLREKPREIWFKSTKALDKAVRARFLGDHERAARGALADWEASPRAALALVLLLDQVPRNIFRGTPRAYASDEKARAAADRAIWGPREILLRGEPRRDFDLEVPPVWRIFFYLPFVHSEEIADQRRALELFAALPPDPNRPEARRQVCRHYQIIARFGRFPHRNAILGRVSTAEETAFLAEPHSSF
jgi:uncharacterized protein (DUF924 family)